MSRCGVTLLCTMLVLVGCESKKKMPHNELAEIWPMYDAAAPVVRPAPAPTVAASTREQTRFADAKAKLKSSRPTTQKQIVAILGEPSQTHQDFMGQGDLLQWYFETHDIGRDVIQCLAHRDGSISMLQY